MPWTTVLLLLLLAKFAFSIDHAVFSARRSFCVPNRHVHSFIQRRRRMNTLHKHIISSAFSDKTITRYIINGREAGPAATPHGHSFIHPSIQPLCQNDINKFPSDDDIFSIKTNCLLALCLPDIIINIVHTFVVVKLRRGETGSAS